MGRRQAGIKTLNRKLFELIRALFGMTGSLETALPAVYQGQEPDSNQVRPGRPVPCLGIDRITPFINAVCVPDCKRV